MPRSLRHRRYVPAGLESLEPRLLLSATKIRVADWLKDMIKRGEEDGRKRISVEEAGVAPATASVAPGPASTINAINFDQDASNAGYYFIPPDNTAAAGPGHVVNVVNCSVQWYTKAGAQQHSQRLGKNSTTAVGSFFESLNPVNTLFDPRAVYDTYASKFVVLATEQTESGSSGTSRILVAISKTSDPNAGWDFYAFNSAVRIGNRDRWADYPTLAVSPDAIYISANMFGFGATGSFRGTRLWIINKSTLPPSGSTLTLTAYDPAGSTGLGTSVFTLQPTMMYGTPQSGGNMFLVSSGQVSGSSEVISIIRIANPTTSPTFTNTNINVGDIDSGGSRAITQLGSGITLDGGDERMYSAVWRDNAIWAACTVTPPGGTDTGQATAHWFKFDTTTLASITLSQQGDVGGEDLGTGTETFYPAVAVDAAGNMAIGFSASSATMYPSAAYTVHAAGDAAGTTQPGVIFAAGQDYYVRTFGTAGLDPNRWGDYSAMAIDPDGSTFWAYNQYAMTRGTAFGGEDGRWATRYASFALTVAPGGISGTVFRDDNGNGTLDGGETFLGGVTVYADVDNSGTLTGSDVSTTSSAINGTYTISGLPPGTYTVREVTPANYVLTTTLTGTSVTSGVTTTGVNRGNFPTVFGSASSEGFYVRMDATGTYVQISAGTAPLATPTYQIARSELSGLTFNLSDGDDTLIFDFANGSMVPSANITVDGGTGTDELRIVGQSASQVFAVTDTAISPATGGTIGYTGIDALTVQSGIFNYNGTFSGFSLLTIAADATFNWLS